MKPLRPLLIAASLLAWTGLHAEDTAPQDDPHEPEIASSGKLPAFDLSPKLLYRFLLAEIAGQRGLVADASEIYLDMARETRDPRIARRATEIALHARRPEAAIAGARLWLELEPDPPSHARQTLVGLLAAQGRYDELAGEVTVLLKNEPLQIDQNLMRLGRFFSRGVDKVAIRQLIVNVTAPYLQQPEAHYVRAQAAYEAQDRAAAQAAIRQALVLKPDWEAAALLQAQLTEDRSEALNGLAAFVANYPKAQDIRMAYARLLVGEKRYVEARREFRRLLENSKPDAPNGDLVFAVAMLSLQLGETADAEQHLQRLVELGHGETDKARFYLGQIAAEHKRWDESVRWYSGIGRGEHYLAARVNAASALAKSGRIDEARQLLRNSAAGDPQERVRLLIGEAQILREVGQLAAAYAVLADSLKQQPDQPEMLYEVALLAERIGRHDELETRLRRLIELRPEHAHAHNALGYSFAERNIRLEEAKKLIDRAVELAPNDPFILDSKGWVLFRLGNQQAALDVLGQAFSIRADPEIAAHLGEVLWVLGRQAEARTTWDKARREHPENEALTETIKRFLP